MSVIHIIYICGIYNLLLAIFHLFFWKIFNWESELKKLHFSNRAIMQILNLRLITVFLLISFIYLFYAQEVVNSELGYVIIVGTGIFWLGRTIEQFVFFNFKSKRVNMLTIVFLLGTIIHFLPLLYI